jgi:hypothetical protein
MHKNSQKVPSKCFKNDFFRDLQASGDARFCPIWAPGTPQASFANLPIGPETRQLKGVQMRVRGHFKPAKPEKMRIECAGFAVIFDLLT